MTDSADRDEAIAACITRYGAALAAQVEQAGGWPAKLVLPEPADDIEREAMRLFVDEVEATTGAAVTVRQ